MALDKATLRLKLGGLSDTDLSDDVADLCLASALNEVNAYHNDRRAESSFTTTAETASYSGATIGAATPQNTFDVTWHPGGIGAPTDDNYSRPYDSVALKSTDELHSILTDRIIGGQIARSRGQWRWVGAALVLDPTPEIATTVVIEYRDDWNLTDDLPPTDLHEQFWRIAKAEALESMASASSEITEIQEGTQRVKLSGGVSRMKAADTLRAEFMKRVPR